MGWFQRPKPVDPAAAAEESAPYKMKKDNQHDKDGSETSNTMTEAQEIMRDNLDIMHDIVMRIKEDPEFAKSIYADCPRLQHHLDQNPDLRPIFEDPKLVLINFEQVYRDAGGKLDGDEDKDGEEKKKTWRDYLAIVVNHPLFKVLRVLLFIKKILSCIFGGGIGMLTSCFHNHCCCSHGSSGGPNAPNPDGNNNNDPNGDHNGDPNGNGSATPTGTSATNAANQAALNKAADHMSDPEVQAQMQELLQNDPSGLQDAINNDPDLSALRDSNPLCAQLMSDPNTMPILTNPDNLRALGACPDLVQADFADPHWLAPDLETGGVDPTSATSGVGHAASVVPTGTGGVEHAGSVVPTAGHDAVPTGTSPSGVPGADATPGGGGAAPSPTVPTIDANGGGGGGVGGGAGGAPSATVPTLDVNADAGGGGGGGGNTFTANQYFSNMENGWNVDGADGGNSQQAPSIQYMPSNTQNKGEDDKDGENGGGGGGGFFSVTSITATVASVVAQELVGMGFQDFAAGAGGGGGDPLMGLTGSSNVDNMAQAVANNQALSQVENVADNAQDVANRQAEEARQNSAAEANAENQDGGEGEDNDDVAIVVGATTAAGVAVVAGGVAVARSGSREPAVAGSAEEEKPESDNPEASKPKVNKFKMAAKTVTATSAFTHAKDGEHLDEATKKADVERTKERLAELPQSPSKRKSALSFLGRTAATFTEAAKTTLANQLLGGVGDLLVKQVEDKEKDKKEPAKDPAKEDEPKVNKMKMAAKTVTAFSHLKDVEHVDDATKKADVERTKQRLAEMEQKKAKAAAKLKVNKVKTAAKATSAASAFTHAKDGEHLDAATKTADVERTKKRLAEMEQKKTEQGKVVVPETKKEVLSEEEAQKKLAAFFAGKKLTARTPAVIPVATTTTSSGAERDQASEAELAKKKKMASLLAKMKAPPAKPSVPASGGGAVPNKDDVVKDAVPKAAAAVSGKKADV